MDKRNFTFLLIFSCFTFFCVYGRSQDKFPSCEARLLLKRGMTWTAAPNRSVTVECPVQLCGKSLNVTWCRVLDTDECEPINQRENVEISQKGEPNEDKLISYLKFRRISVHDDGLYRCELKASYLARSHIMNISVSASYQGVQVSHIHNAAAEARVADVVEDVEDKSWLLYFYICVGIAILAALLMLFGIFRFFGRKGVLIVNQKMRPEIYTNTLPGLPASAPSTSVRPTHFQILHENFSHTAVRSVPQPNPLSPRSQPAAIAVAHTADRSLSSDHAVYAAINRRQAEEPARALQGRTTNKNTEYASIKFVNSSQRCSEVSVESLNVCEVIERR